MPTTAAARLSKRIESIPDAMLCELLRHAERQTRPDSRLGADERPHWNLVRSSLIGEVERRWPAASAAVGAAFDAAEVAEARGEDVQVDYVRVLLAHVPGGTDPAEVTRFETLGRDAYRAGQMAAPALSAQVSAALEGLAVGSVLALDVMRAFSRGYSAEADAAAAEVLG